MSGEKLLSRWRFKIIVPLFLALLATLVGLWFFYFNRATPLWGQGIQTSPEREKVTLDHHAEILEDYFLYERLGESLHYKLEHQIEQNSLHSEQKIQNAFQKALDQVFKGKVRPPEAMIVLSQGGLFEKFNNFFLQELHKNEVDSGLINWNLKFTPEQHLNLNYKQHLESEQTFEWKPQLNWTDELQQKPQRISDTLKDLTIPGNGRPFQYLAGAIHYQLDLDQLEQPESELGRLTFRKYYRVDEGRPFRQYFESSGFELEHIRLKSETSAPLITVDLVESFSLKDLAPSLSRINLNFSGVVEDISAEKANVNPKNRLTLVGELSTDQYDQLFFEMNIINLSFKINRGIISNLDEKKTNFSIKLLPEELNLKDSSLFKQQIKNKILREHQRDLLKSIKADLFSSRLMGGVQL